MENRRKSFIFLETGDACSVEFRMVDGEFRATEDAAVIGISEGQTPEDAYNALLEESPWVKEYRTDRIEAREIGGPTYI